MRWWFGAGRLRRVSNPWTLTGEVVALDGETLTVMADGGERPIEMLRSDITSVEVSQGRPRGRGALRGAAIGALLGLGVGGILALGCEGLECAVVFLPIWTVTIGAGIGALFPGKRWKPINTNDLHVALTPTPGGGVGAQVAFSF